MKILADLVKLDSPLKCMCALLAVFGSVVVLSTFIPDNSTESSWKKISPAEATSGTFDVKTSQGMRGEMIFWGKVK